MHHPDSQNITFLYFLSSPSALILPYCSRKLCSLLTIPQAPSLAESLPTELFHKILKELPISSVLAVKFTCRAFYAKTLHHDGTEVVDLKKAVVDEMPSRSDYYIDRPPNSHFDEWRCSPPWQEIKTIAATLIDFELRDTRILNKLTCSICARCKPNGPAGFPDMYFAQREPARYCNACCYAVIPGWMYPEPFLVLGVLSTHCYHCCKVMSLEDPHVRWDGRKAVCSGSPIRCLRHE